jgi:hypothetical protein
MLGYGESLQAEAESAKSLRGGDRRFPYALL